MSKSSSWILQHHNSLKKSNPITQFNQSSQSLTCKKKCIAFFFFVLPTLKMKKHVPPKKMSSTLTKIQWAWSHLHGGWHLQGRHPWGLDGVPLLQRWACGDIALRMVDTWTSGTPKKGSFSERNQQQLILLIRIYIVYNMYTYVIQGTSL